MQPRVIVDLYRKVLCESRPSPAVTEPVKHAALEPTLSTAGRCLLRSKTSDCRPVNKDLMPPCFELDTVLTRAEQTSLDHRLCNTPDLSDFAHGLLRRTRKSHVVLVISKSSIRVEPLVLRRTAQCKSYIIVGYDEPHQQKHAHPRPLVAYCC